MLKPGDMAPAFEAEDHRGGKVSLEALRGRGPVVVFFYPKDFTPVCTREACGFQDQYKDLQESGAEVVGISVDSAESHRRFATEHGLDYPLLSDPDRRLAKLFEVLHPFGLGAKRATFVIDRQGIVRMALHSEVFAKKHVEAVRQALTKL